MRALRFDGKVACVDPQARALSPALGEALVKPILTGICATDTEIVRSGGTFTGTLGHEFVGVVQAVNVPSDASPMLAAAGAMVGKRVVGSINIVCEKCEMCKRGLSAHCRNRTVLGVSGRDGVFADEFTIPIRNLVLVPDSVSDEEAVFAEPLASALHVAQAVRVEGKPYITVLGDGKLGLLTVQVMARLNASVRLLGKHPEKFGLCDKWAIKHRHISEVGRRQDQDIVVDCTGSASGLALAMALVRPRGKIIVKSAISPVPLPPGAPVPGANHPAWATPINLAPLVINEIELIGSRCGSIAEAVSALAHKHVSVAPLITHRVSLDEAPALIAQPHAGQIKALIDHTRMDSTKAERPGAEQANAASRKRVA